MAGIKILSGLLLWTSCHAVTDTLKPGDTLKYRSSLLVSATGKFTLDFQEYESSCYLVLRWMGTTDDAWIANRDRPVLCSAAALTLDTNKTLKITGDSGDPLVLYSASEEATSNNSTVVAILLDSGNFMLQEVIGKRVLWQSFDYPTNTLLPGMKLGVNHTDGRSWSLSSYLSYSIPAKGAHTLEWDPNGLELQIRQHGVVIWGSGVLRDGRFEFIPSREDDDDNESKQLVGYNFTSVSIENEASYFSYTISNQSYGSGWTLWPSGMLYDQIGDYIAEANKCKGNNTDEAGCRSWLPIYCRHPGDRFVLGSGNFNPTTSDSKNKSDPSTNLTFTDCQTTCWENCDCSGYNILFYNYTGCQFLIGKWEFKQDDLSGDGTSLTSLYFLTTNSSHSNGTIQNSNTSTAGTIQNPNTSTAGTIHNSNTSKWITKIGASIAAASLAMVLCIVCYLRRRIIILLSLGENKTNTENELLDLMESDVWSADHVNGIQNDGRTRHDLRIFSYASIMAATCNFSEENKLGEGGFGPVYKGKLTTRREIAVKRLSRSSGQGTLEFKNELLLISELQHTNLVQLLGFCIHGEERMLIYEYMPNRSLDKFLFVILVFFNSVYWKDSTRGMLVDWKKRFNIIEGIAQGLLYLHKYSRLRVIHRDLKASNILLDENMNPKISDFGMARIFTHNELEANTNRVVGTYGYMSPEYAMEGIFSFKSDVYSFGVLLLEIISGRRNSSFYNEDRVVNIVGHAWELWKEGAWEEIMDPKLGDSCVRNQFLRCIHVGLLCVEENAADRPTTSHVISMLTNESMPLPLPTKPAFFTGRKAVGAVGGRNEPEIMTINGLSISEFDAR